MATNGPQAAPSMIARVKLAPANYDGQPLFTVLETCFAEIQRNSPAATGGLACASVNAEFPIHANFPECTAEEVLRALADIVFRTQIRHDNGVFQIGSPGSIQSRNFTLSPAALEYLQLNRPFHSEESKMAFDVKDQMRVLGYHVAGSIGDPETPSFSAFFPNSARLIVKLSREDLAKLTLRLHLLAKGLKLQLTPPVEGKKP
jgi:hypothetical protein